MQAEVFGRAMPTAQYLPTRERARLIAGHAERSRWARVGQPSDGDMVMMGRMPGCESHCGVWLADLRRVIHTDQPHGVVTDTLIELEQIRGWRMTFYTPLRQTA